MTVVMQELLQVFESKEQFEFFGGKKKRKAGRKAAERRAWRLQADWLRVSADASLLIVCLTVMWWAAAGQRIEEADKGWIGPWEILPETLSRSPLLCPGLRSLSLALSIFSHSRLLVCLVFACLPCLSLSLFLLLHPQP